MNIHRKTRSFRLLFLFSLMALIVALGCGKKDGSDDADKNGSDAAIDRRSGNSVSGTVKLAGEPVNGTVFFVGADNKQYGPAPANADGRYFIEGAPPGKYTVVVKATPGAPKVLMTELPDAPSGKAVAPPAAYADAKKSPLSYEVKTGEQTFDIDLKP